MALNRQVKQPRVLEASIKQNVIGTPHPMGIQVIDGVEFANSLPARTIDVTTTPDQGFIDVKSLLFTSPIL